MTSIIRCDRCLNSTTPAAVLGWFTLIEQHEEGTHTYHYCSTVCLGADWRPVT